MIVVYRSWFRWILPAFCAAACIFSYAQINSHQSAAARTPSSIAFGFYDPDATRPKIPASIRHVFINWFEFDAKKFARLDAQLAHKDRTLLLTLEPWTARNYATSGRAHLLEDTIDGRHDRMITSICASLTTAKSRIWLRWGHEMDDRRVRYPWAGHSPKQYIAAYRHFAAVCRKSAPNLPLIWSPKGEDRALAYYPGDDVVDYLGLSIFCLENWDREHGDGTPETISTHFGWKFDRLRNIRKPIIIAELGLAGTDRQRAAWLEQLQDLKRHRADIKAIVYFNAKEPFHWPNGYGSPDWRLAKNELVHLALTLQN